jgi:hypothetical protein
LQFYQHYNQQQIYQKSRNAEQAYQQQQQMQQQPQHPMQWNRNFVCSECNECVCNCNNLADMSSGGKTDNSNNIRILLDRRNANTLNDNLSFATNENNIGMSQSVEYGIVVDDDQVTFSKFCLQALYYNTY